MNKKIPIHLSQRPDDPEAKTAKPSSSKKPTVFHHLTEDILPICVIGCDLSL
jgi:hypothetical protein